jgi:FixJ family two-component response regulator
MRTRVLVAEPDQDLAARVVARLDRTRWEPFVVASAEEALDLDGVEPTALVSELRLPGASGLDLLAALNDRGARPYTVFVSALPTFHDCRKAFRLGAADLLPKPVCLDELCRVLDACPAPAPAETAAPTELVHATRATAAGATAAVREVLAFALRVGAAPAARARLAGALAEVVENARLHAYDRDTDERLRPLLVAARHDGADIEVQVADEGRGCDAARARLDAVPAVLPWSEGEPTGLARAATLVEALDVSSSEHGTRVTLRVSIGRVSFDRDDATDLSDLDYLDPRRAGLLLRAVRTGRGGDVFNISPALAVVVGRLLAGATPAQVAQTSLWS